MDILLGLCLLTSLVSLEYGSMTGERPPLTLFLILSLATMAVYWLWFLYLKYAKMESEASKEVRGGVHWKRKILSTRPFWEDKDRMFSCNLGESSNDENNINIVFFSAV